MRRTVAAAVFNLLLLLATTTPFVFGANVTYNRRGLVIGGERRVLISGSIHYMRSTPEVSSSAFSFTRTEKFAVFARILKSCIFPPFFMYECECRCGQIWWKNQRTEDWMWFKLLFSGICTSQFVVRWNSASFFTYMSPSLSFGFVLFDGKNCLTPFQFPVSEYQ